jgi:hypothetical protein
MSLLLPQGLERSVPDWFASQLRALDPNLIVYFNYLKGRWIIDRCTRGGSMNAAMHEHTSECPRTNVMVVQDGAQYMPLCDQVLNDLRSKDSWKHGTAEQFVLHHENAMQADEERRSALVDDAFRHASLDNRRQLMKAYDLTQIHDTARVNQ